jgi:hypothetical protein
MHLVAALSRELESNAPDPFNLMGVVVLRIYRALLAAAEIDLFWFGKIDAAGQFANDHEIEPIDEFALQRRGIRERRIADRRAQIWRRDSYPCEAAKDPPRGRLHKGRHPISARRRRQAAPRPPLARAMSASLIAVL